MIFFVYFLNNLGESAKVCKEGYRRVLCSRQSVGSAFSHSNHGESFKGRCKVQFVMCMQQEARKQLWIGAQG